MTRFIKRSVFTLALAIGSPLFAISPSFAANGWLSGRISELVIQSSSTGNTFIVLDTSTIVGQCAKNGTATMILIPDDAKGSQMFSSAQAVLLTGKSMSIFLDDGGAADSVYCFAKIIKIN